MLHSVHGNAPIVTAVLDSVYGNAPIVTAVPTRFVETFTDRDIKENRKNKISDTSSYYYNNISYLTSLDSKIHECGMKLHYYYYS